PSKNGLLERHLARWRMAGAERFGLAAGLNGLLVGAESLGGALLLLGRRQIFLAGGNGPADSERIAHLTVTVTPELVADGHSDFAIPRRRRPPRLRRHREHRG